MPHHFSGMQAFDAQALLEAALREKQWQLPEEWREGVLANIRRIHGMMSELDQLPPEAGGLERS